ncbi:uncharacterized protein LOC122010322 isoform X2 [Zingiber officinale]|uniref:uncharacterized protein LOC122010322 isoform X2 n=1 Tax=Zingiber officinale TaxID=94328 RepID=UPI001C4AFB5B|nr:uncharacterized protein LOC122010322 isoform X2 [Zingiber officinale]
MARFLLQVLFRDRFPFHRLIAIRGRSRARIIEVDLAAAEEAGEVEGEVDVDVLSLRHLENAVHAISVRRAAPDWLPFVPGSSYWVPAPRRVGGVADVVRKLANPLTKEETMSLTSIGRWPSSAYFVEGKSITVASPHSVKKNMKKASAQSDDED